MARSIHRAGAAAGLTAALVLAGCAAGSNESGGDGDTLRFAVVAEQTGDYGAYGAQLVAGVESAAEDLNASGEYDFELEPVIYDCQSDQAICVSKTRQAVTTDGLPLVMGPIVSLDVLPAAEVTERADVPHIVMAVLPEITDDYGNTFRWSTQNDRNNQTVVDYVEANLKPGETVAIVHANTDFGNGGAEEQAEFLEDAGINPVATISHDPEQADYTPVMVELQQADPRYILLSDTNPADVAKLLRQSKEAGIEGEWIGADASGSIELAGDAAVGYMTVSPWFPNDAADPKSAELTAKLEAQDVEDPGWIAAMAYDATKGVAEAAQAEGMSAEDLKAGLEGLTDMPGTAAPAWTFTPDDHTGLPESRIAVWTGDGYETVWPK